ncbi:MAG: aldo/keto reductase [Actinomycetota bacterium]
MTSIDRLPFGTTGHQSSRIIFGAAALGAMSQSRADTTLAQIRDADINHIDTAASYGDSELRLHDFLQDHRTEFFLATKTGERRGDAARAQLEASLERMGVDRVDLIQLHNLVEPEEWEVAFGEGGAVRALFDAVDDGLAAAVGVTGHGLRIPTMHLRSLAEAPFASVLFPWNHSLAASAAYTSDVDALVEVCVERGVAMQTIKSVSRRRWAADHHGPRFAWYEPLAVGDAFTRAIEFVLADPRLFLNTSSDARLLDATLQAVARHDGSAPSASALERDRDEQGIVPLFDGGELEGVR